MKTLKRYRYRIYPNTAQRVFLEKAFGCCRFVYNELLARTVTSYELYKNGEIPEPPKVSGFDFIYQIPKLRETYPWLLDAPSGSLGIAVQNLGRGFQGFFKNDKTHPVFKRNGKES